MTGVVATFGDAVAETSTALRDRLAGRDEPYAAGVKVGAHVPADGWPFVQVAVDGTPNVVYPVVARSTVRVTVWHVDGDQAHDLAQLCQGLLLSAPTDRAAFVELTGPLRAVDDKTGVDLASFTVRASLTGSRA